jgi:hypothetical protein
MKHLLALLLCASFVLCASAQERSLSPRRGFQPAPVLLTMAGSDDAAGFAQTPQGYALPLYAAPVPAESRVGIYGRSLSASTFSVMLWHSGGVERVTAESSRNAFPGLETVSFRLPADVRGEVWVTVIGRQTSNTVRLTVE